MSGKGMQDMLPREARSTFGSLKKFAVGVIVGTLVTMVAMDESSVSDYAERLGVQQLGVMRIASSGAAAEEAAANAEVVLPGEISDLEEASKLDEAAAQQGLLAAANNSAGDGGDWAPPDRLDWLHVPKTGTSFLYSILQYQCDKAIAKPNKALEKASLEKYATFVIKGLDRTPCQRGLRFYHSPLKKHPERGHNGYAVKQTVTMFRAPLPRLASGLVHKFHQCNVASLRSVMKPQQVCRALMDGNSTATELAKAHKVIRMYAECVQGCQARMSSGAGLCGHFGEPTVPKGETREKLVERAITKMKSFAFVGLTEHWAESMCMWRRQFQRRSGHPYLIEYTLHNSRPGLNRKCEDFITEYLESIHFQDDLDHELYAAAQDLFKERLGDCENTATDKNLHLDELSTLPND